MKNIKNDIKSERLKVYVRVRPFVNNELTHGEKTSFTNIDPEKKTLSIQKDYYIQDYNFDGVYDMNSTQNEIFEISAKPVIEVNTNN